MTEPHLIRAILEDPEADAPRLAYASWLDANGQPDRAEWIRLSCQFAELSPGHPQRQPLLLAVRDSFSRCRPEWWQELSSINQRNDRGMYRFCIGAAPSSRSATAFKRLGSVPWLSTAADGGWLQRLEVLWCDTEASRLLAAWKAPARAVPLLVRPAPQIAEEGLRRIFALPQLQALILETAVLRSPAIADLATACPNLRDLTLEFRLLDDRTADAALAQAERLPLHRLHLQGHALLDHGHRPNDQDLLGLSGIPTLRRLDLTDCPAVSEAAFAELSRAASALRVRRN